MVDLSRATYDELQAEIKKRDKIIKEAEKPKQLDNPNWNLVKSMCQEHINNLNDGLINSNSVFEEYLYEAVLTALYGENVFEWINEQIP